MCWFVVVFFLCSLPPQNSEWSGASGLLKKISEKIICGDNQKGAFFVPMLSVAKCPLWAVGPVCAPSPWESISLHPTVGWAHPASSKFVSPTNQWLYAHKQCDAAHSSLQTGCWGLQQTWPQPLSLLQLCFAMCMLGNPAVLLLDEPSTGMDPKGQRCVWWVGLGHRAVDV